jgi:sulfate adenylyltransferase subunit 1 (EFTu-like GTPase family)
LTRVISDSADMYPTWLKSDKHWHVEYVPVNVKLGFNLTPVNKQFSWHKGADLLTTLAENQKRNYYDEDLWNKLVNSPVYFPLVSAMKISGIGTVAGGILLSRSDIWYDTLFDTFDRWDCRLQGRSCDLSRHHIFR